MAPAAADNLCTPSGKEGAMALPEKLVTASPPEERDYTTADVEPLSSVNIDALGLRTPRTLTIGTQPGGPPTSCLNTTGRYTGYDNELLRAIAAKLGLNVVFAGTEFAGLLAQVATRRFDVASSSIVATEARRRTVGFTNGYDFGYLSLIVPSGSPLRQLRQTGCGAADRRHSGHRRRGLRRRHRACAAGEIPRLHHPVHLPEEPSDRRVGGAGNGGGQSDAARR